MSRFWFVVLSLVLFVVGLVIVFGSVTWGSQAANAYLRSQGGGMDGSQFMVIFQEYIQIYRWTGSIVSIIGGLALIKAINVK
jgi:hypothetical protein